MAILNSDYGKIIYTLTRRKGMKNIRIKIKNDGSVCVSANTSVPVSTIERFISDKAQWIITHSNERHDSFEHQIEAIPHDNCILQIWGKQYTLHIKQDDNERIEIQDNELILYTNDTEQAHVEALLLQYIAETGREFLSKCVKKYLAISCYPSVPPRLSLKMLKSKWGHCSYKDNEIMLNFALCGLPAILSEYVAAHEVAHLFVRNHSPQFYAFGEKIMPNFRAYDKALNKFSTNLWGNVVR